MDTDKSGTFPEELTVDKARVSVENLNQKIAAMGVGDKIKLALLGNKEARGILIKTPNKLIAKAVLKSPKITEAEIVDIAQSRNIDGELLDIIACNKQWIQNYQIRYHLINNPKTPIRVALKFLSRLNMKDMKAIAKNRNIPSAIRNTAKYIVQNKSKV